MDAFSTLSYLHSDSVENNLHKLYLFLSFCFILFCIYRIYIVYSFRKNESLRYKRSIDEIKFKIENENINNRNGFKTHKKSGSAFLEELIE